MPRPQGVDKQGAFDFEGTVDRFQTPLLRYVGQILGPPSHTAEEVVQEAFLRLHGQTVKHGAESIKHLPSWLFRVAHNLAISSTRKQIKHDKLDDPEVRYELAARAENGESNDMLDDLIHREMCDRAVAELHRLPPYQKQVLLLKIIQGFTLKQISEITGMSVSNTSYRLNQGLRELAKRLKDVGMV